MVNTHRRIQDACVLCYKKDREIYGCIDAFPNSQNFLHSRRYMCVFETKTVAKYLLKPFLARKSFFLPFFLRRKTHVPECIQDPAVFDLYLMSGLYASTPVNQVPK